MPVIQHSVTVVLEVKWTELYQIWSGPRPVMRFQIRFRYVALIQNEGDTKMAAVNIEIKFRIFQACEIMLKFYRPTFMHYGHCY